MMTGGSPCQLLSTHSNLRKRLRGSVSTLSLQIETKIQSLLALMTDICM